MLIKALVSMKWITLQFMVWILLLTVLIIL
jgi:hypothetical protein